MTELKSTDHTDTKSQIANTAPSRRRGILADVKSNDLQQTRGNLSPTTMLACDSMVTLLGQLARKVAISTSNAALEQKLAASLQAIPSPYACTETTTYQALFLSIKEQVKAAPLQPKNITWNEIYTSILQKIVKQELA